MQDSDLKKGGGYHESVTRDPLYKNASKKDASCRSDKGPRTRHPVVKRGPLKMDATSHGARDPLKEMVRYEAVTGDPFHRDAS